MNDSSIVAAWLLLVCFVPPAIAVGISKPHYDMKYITVRSEKICPPDALNETHWPGGRVTCMYQKLPQGVAAYERILTGERK